MQNSSNSILRDDDETLVARATGVILSVLPVVAVCVFSLSVLMAISRWTWISQCLLKQRMMEVVVTTGAINRAKLQSNHHHQQTNTQFFTGRMPFLSPNQQCQSIEGKNITFHRLAYPKLTWGLPTSSLTTISSWLPWVRVAMPLISSLMPVPQPYVYCVI